MNDIGERTTKLSVTAESQIANRIPKDDLGPPEANAAVARGARRRGTNA